MANVVLREPLSQLYLLVHHEWLLVKPLNTMKKYSDLKDLQWFLPMGDSAECIQANEGRAKWRLLKTDSNHAYIKAV